MKKFIVELKIAHKTKLTKLIKIICHSFELLFFGFEIS
jgi:hypothetical protein